MTPYEVRPRQTASLSCPASEQPTVPLHPPGQASQPGFHSSGRAPACRSSSTGPYHSALRSAGSDRARSRFRASRSSGSSWMRCHHARSRSRRRWATRRYRPAEPVPSRALCACHHVAAAQPATMSQNSTCSSSALGVNQRCMTLCIVRPGHDPVSYRSARLPGGVPQTVVDGGESGDDVLGSLLDRGSVILP